MKASRSHRCSHLFCLIRTFFRTINGAQRPHLAPGETAYVLIIERAHQCHSKYEVFGEFSWFHKPVLVLIKVRRKLYNLDVVLRNMVVFVNRTLKQL